MQLPKRVGVISKKLGMTHIYADSGEAIPVTALAIEDCTVIETFEKEKSSCVKVGAFSVKEKNLTKPLAGYFKSKNAQPKKYIKEFNIEKGVDLPVVGQTVKASHFVIGQNVDVTAVSIGKGFAGGMKRHNFGGLRASHGVSISHRSHGSTGQCQDPGKVFKGKKMAGQMGNTQVTKQNLSIVSIDDEAGVVFVKGAVPGAKNAIVYMKDSIKKQPSDALVVPGVFEE